MKHFQITNDNDLDLTIIRFSGKIVASDIVDAIHSFYQSEITSKVLLDFSGCDFTALPSKDLTAIVNEAKGLSSMRPNGKSAIVGPSDLLFGLSRMYATLTEVKNHPVPNRAFRSKEEALEWLNSHH